MKYSFVVDKSLGSLAKWLRIFGFDTVCETDVSPREFYNHLQEQRVLITRTGKRQKSLINRDHVFIESNFLLEQLKQVVGHLDIQPADIQLFSRCIHCNLITGEVDKADVWGMVPDYIWETQEKFNSCRRCGRIYWPGSHTERISDKIKQIFDSP
jgi:uncharacterized protein with PIN domain